MGLLVSEAHGEMILDYRSTNRDPPETYNDVRTADLNKLRICVFVRKRPLSDPGDVDVVTVSGKKTVVLHEPKIRVDLTPDMMHHRIEFDRAFDEHVDNERVYRVAALPLLEHVFASQGTATCFAYGQTGSGKTHTMSGPPNTESAPEGLYAYAARDIIDLMQDPRYADLGLTLGVSFYEIYGGKAICHTRRRPLHLAWWPVRAVSYACKHLAWSAMRAILAAAIARAHRSTIC